MDKLKDFLSRDVFTSMGMILLMFCVAAITGMNIEKLISIYLHKSTTNIICVEGEN